MHDPLGKSTPWSVVPLAMFSQYIPTCASKIVKYAYQETKKINVVSYWSWQVSSYYGKAPQESLYLNLIKFVILWSKKLFAIAIFYFISTLSNWLNDQLIEWGNIAQNGPFSRPQGGRGHSGQKRGGRRSYLVTLKFKVLLTLICPQNWAFL